MDWPAIGERVRKLAGTRSAILPDDGAGFDAGYVLAYVHSDIGGKEAG
jgi:hypothetical protein